MSANAQLARIFDEMASGLELQGANVFRVNAHRNVARVLREMTDDVSDLAADVKNLTAIDGIGAGSAAKIKEYVDTGHVQEYEQLFQEIPRGLLDVLKISGLGPKTVKVMWEQGDVTDMQSLEAKLEDGTLEGLPRMGAKSIKNIQEAVAFAKRAAQRTRLGDTIPIAEQIIDHLKATVEGLGPIEYAGSLRRGQETIGDIDILAAATKSEPLVEAFTSMPEVTGVLAAGTTKCSVRLEADIQVDLRIIDQEAFGAALLYFTGSKQHNVVLRERAVKKQMRLNEYGLFPDDGEEAPPQTRGIEPLAAQSEQAIYESLGLPWIAPELREDRGEFRNQLPDLIELEDVKSELHAHTRASDGHMSIDELAQAARARGFHTIAVTDHSVSSVQANGLDPDRLRRHIDAIREADARTEGISILAGSEVDILIDGSLDYQDDLLAQLDVVVASPHVSLKQEAAVATARVLAAIEHPLVHIIGHPTGRVINRRPGLPLDINAIVAAAAEHDTALEINASTMRLDLRDVHVRAAVDAGARIAINTDAHSRGDFEQLRYGVMTARRGWLAAEGCVNTWTKKRLDAWLRNKR
jgi:DNA polymerase (family 10)